MEKGISGTPGAAIVVPFTNRRPGAPCGPRPPSFFHWRDFKDWVVGMVGKFIVDLTTKADKVSGGTAGNLASIGDGGSLVDSGIRPYTFDTVPTAGSLNPVTSGGIKQAIDAATPGDYESLKARLATAEGKIPEQASAQNQLADKAFVNSSIATNTAFYISDGGRPFQSLADLETYEGTLTNNDYAFVVGRDTAGNTTYTRYKWNEATETWAEEYVLNNSSFTAAQWEAISSGITSALVAKLGALPTAEQLAAQLLDKYEKPSAGIPKTDLAAGVQASLDKADTALQTAPVTSVNNKTGAVSLTASDVGAVPLTDEVVYTEAGIRACYNTRTNTNVSDRGILIGTASAIHTFATLYSNASISGWESSEGTRATLLLPFPWASKNENMLALLSDIAVKSVKLNGAALTPDANGAVNVPALPLKGGTMTGDVVLKWQNTSGAPRIVWTNSNNDAQFRMQGVWDNPVDGMALQLQGGTNNNAYATIILRTQGGFLAFAASNFTANNLAALDASGNPVDSGIAKTAVAPLASPAFTGTPTAPTPASGDDSTKVATTAFVKAAVEGSAPTNYLKSDRQSITTAGVYTDWLINSSLDGGLRVRYSSTNLTNYTEYGYDRIKVVRNGGVYSFFFDPTRENVNGIVRRRELGEILASLNGKAGKWRVVQIASSNPVPTDPDRTVLTWSPSSMGSQAVPLPTIASGAAVEFYVAYVNDTSAATTLDFSSTVPIKLAVKIGEDLQTMTTFAAGAKAMLRLFGMQWGGEVVWWLERTDLAAGGSATTWSLNADGTVSTEGGLNADGTLTVEGELNADGTLTVEAQ